MNTKSYLWLAILCGLLPRLTFANDAPPLPRECHLANGAVLHHIKVLKWGEESVTLKHDGGADPIRYSNMADADRAAFEAGRDYAEANPQPEVPKAPQQVSFTGQAFVNTVGDGSVKIGGMTIYAFPDSAWSAFDDAFQDPLTPMTVKLPKPLATTVTDGDGNFKMTVPGTDPFIIFGIVWRSFGHGAYAYVHRYTWRIKSSDIGDDVILSQPQHGGSMEAALTLDIASN